MVKESWECLVVQQALPPHKRHAYHLRDFCFVLLIPTRRNNPRRDLLHLRSAGIIHRFGAFYSLALGLSMSLTICRTNPRMEFAMLKDCWNNLQIWGLLSPTWSRQDGTKSLPSSLHPLSSIHRPPSFPKVSHHDSHHRHQSYFSEYLIAFSKFNLVLTLLTGRGLGIFWPLRRLRHDTWTLSIL